MSCKKRAHFLKDNIIMCLALNVLNVLYMYNLARRIFFLQLLQEFFLKDPAQSCNKSVEDVFCWDVLLLLTMPIFIIKYDST